MKRLLNTLYITTRDCKLSLDNEGILVKKPDGGHVRVVGCNIDSIVCFGNTSVTTPLVHYCTRHGISIAFLSDGGTFYGRIQGPTVGNITLRAEQYRHLLQETPTRLQIVKSMLSAKLYNSRQVLIHAAGDALPAQREILRKAIGGIDLTAGKIDRADSIDAIRGYEGTAASIYFDAFPALIKSVDPAMAFTGRNRRPPRDAVNAMLSYCYTLLAALTEGALESVGL